MSSAESIARKGTNLSGAAANFFACRQSGAGQGDLGRRAGGCSGDGSSMPASGTGRLAGRLLTHLLSHLVVRCCDNVGRLNNDNLIIRSEVITIEGQQVHDAVR